MLADRYRTIRRGVTLVELLIVVSIMIILAAIALPAMQTGMESRRTREAALAFHVYLGSAQVRAIETGRPVGVLLERSEIDPRASILVRQVEIPPPYAGDFDTAVTRVQDWTINPATGLPIMPGYHVLRVAIRSNDLAPGLIQPGNTIQLNHQGPFYEIVYYGATDFPLVDGYFDFTVGTDAEPDGWIDSHVLTLRLEYSQVANLPWPRVTVANTPLYPTPNPTSGTATPGGLFTGEWSAALPFQIIRNPVPSSAGPLKLPRGMVIDLDDSGYDYGVPDLIAPYPTMARDEFAARDAVYGVPGAKDLRPVLVMFGPDGSVEQVYHSYFVGAVLNYGGRYVHGTIFFMIGRASRTGDTNDTTYLTPSPEDNLENWQDAKNLWLALNPQTGRVTVAEVNADVRDPITDVYTPSNLIVSRAYARLAQVRMGGR
jgi:prepilin-type N-terminal cleavage/methylation domain-containing protein